MVTGNDLADDSDTGICNETTGVSVAQKEPTEEKVNEGHYDNEIDRRATKNIGNKSSIIPNKIVAAVKNYTVHCHVNGLCILTIGRSMQQIISELTKDTKETTNVLQSVQFHVSPSKSQSVGQKRKQAKKMKRGINHMKKHHDKERNQGVIAPGDIIASVQLQSGCTIQIISCIFGTVLELNQNIINDPSLLLQDPLLDGYIGVVLPNGTYPPFVNMKK